MALGARSFFRTEQAHSIKKALKKAKSGKVLSSVNFCRYNHLNRGVRLGTHRQTLVRGGRSEQQRFATATETDGLVPAEYFVEHLPGRV